MIKCVVWDLDGTIWDGVALEGSRDAPPEPFAEALRVMRTLEERGIVNSLVSRTDPSVREMVAGAPQLAGRFVHPHFGWGPKSEAIQHISDALGIRCDALAFVDDSPFERAEVGAALPDVWVFAPEELPRLLETPLFLPATTPEARSRVDLYRLEEARRRAQRDFVGSQEEFLSWCGMRLSRWAARPGDAERLTELAARTHRLNSTGEQLAREEVCRMIGDAAWHVPVARLSDRFGDYGLIAGAFVDRGRGDGGDTAWRLRLLSVSCRVAGRGVARAFLATIVASARASGVRRLLAEVRTTEANIELRVLLRQFGFRTVDGRVDLLDLDPFGPVPEAPPWIEILEEG